MPESVSYINGYLYVILRPDPSGNLILYCAGVNIRRFNPLTWGRHAQFMNPAFRGLQLLRLKSVVPMVLEAGGSVKKAPAAGCLDLPQGDGWFRESLEISGVPSGFADRSLLPFVRALAGIVIGVCLPGQKIPDDVSDPAALEQFLDHLATSAQPA